VSLLDAAAGILNASQPLPWLLVSGQPTEAQFAALHAAGITTVIDLREEMEPRGFEEGETVAGLGITYRNAPVVAGALDDLTMTTVLDALRAASGTPTLLHCNSANRTGGPLLAYLVLSERTGVEAATATAMRSGLRSVEVMEWAAEYARNHQQP